MCTPMFPNKIQGSTILKDFQIIAVFKPGSLISASFGASGGITKTRLFKYIENLISKNWKFSDKKTPIFFLFLLKT